MKAAPSPLLVQSAAARIYAAWLPLIGETEARDQAQAFANRFSTRPVIHQEHAPCGTTA